jgi:flavin reductase (DIM6/NTAB) family NADH-FMN oxidoreductase RutF
VTPMTTTVPARVFRDAVGEFATGVAVVVVADGDRTAGMTLNSFASVSLDPLLVLIALGHGSRTLSLVAHTGRFSISILHRAQRDVAIDFAAPGAPFPAQHTATTRDGFVVIAGAASTHHCTVRDVIRAGDHDLVLGQVIGITHMGGEPLVFHRGKFGGLATDALVPPGHPIALEEGAGW